MFFHPKNLKSGNNIPWFDLLLHTQSIGCATVVFRVLGIYHFALCLDGCESHGLSTTKLTYSYTVRQPPPSMHSARSGTTIIIWFKILIFFQVQIFSGSHKKISILYLTLLIGQLISEWLFGIFNFPKNQQKKLMNLEFKKWFNQTDKSLFSY